MAMDVSKLAGSSKDKLHKEWADFKVSAKVSAKPVCPYAIGGQRDTPISALDSVSKGMCIWEECLKLTIDPTVDRSRGVLPSEVMVGAEGQVTLYPPRRHINIEVGGSTPGSTVSSASKASQSKPKSLPGVPIPKGKPQTPKAALMTAVEQSGNYMLDHIKRISENGFITGNNKILFICLASAALVRNRLNAYKDILKQPSSKNLTSALGRCGEMVEFLMQNILSYNCDLLHSALLHDPASHDWTNVKPYHENEKFSESIQMWAFYMQGVRNDLWQYTSPRMSESILASIFTDTLSILVTRYAQIEPSDMRLQQYKADVVAILTIVAATLPSLVASPTMLFSVRIHESVALPIHRRADLLLKVAALKCAPIENVARIFHKGFDNAVKRTGYPDSPTSIESTPAWLTFLNPSLFPHGQSSLRFLGDHQAVYLTLLTVASRPQPQYPLIIRGLLMRKFLGTKTLMEGLHDAPGQVTAGKPCDGPMCMPHLCSPPLIPHTVYAAIAQIVMRCVDWTPALSNLIGPGVKQSGLWDSLDRTQVMRAVPPKPPAKPAHPSQLSVRLEHHLAAWTLQLLTGLEGVADSVPLPVIYAAHTINTYLPPTIKPTGGHVVTHLVVNALYSTVNSRESLDQLNDSPITDGQWDMMIAVGERLCSLHDGNYDTHLKQMTRALLLQLEDLEDEEEEDSLDDYTDEDVIDSVCNALVNTVLSSVQGQHALVVIWEFLKRNMEWMQEALEVPALLPLTSSNPPTALNFSPKPSVYNPLHYYKRMIYTRLDQESLMNFKGDWDAILWSDLGMPKETIVDILRQRPEFQEDPYLTPSQKLAMKKLAPFVVPSDDCSSKNEE